MTIKNVYNLLRCIKPTIHDDSRADDDPDNDIPGIVVTIASDDGGEWAYQTGDNSYTGACYHYKHWAIIYLYRDSNCYELARDAVNELKDTIATYNTDQERI